MFEERLFFAILTIVFGVGAVVKFFQCRRALQSRDWPTAPARIQRSEPSAEPMTRGFRIFVPRIEYAYQVAGREYRGDRLTLGRDGWYTGAPDRAAERCRDYPVGLETRVHFDPRRPEVSCLERAEGLIAASFAVPVLMGLTCLVLAWFQFGIW